MAKGEKAPCPQCPATVAVTTGGTIRKHPKGVEEPCPGTGAYVHDADDPTPRVSVPRPRPLTNPKPPRDPAAPKPILVPGIYRSPEEMLEQGVAVRPGHVLVSIIAMVPYDGMNGRNPNEEATLLFEDPNYLGQVLDKVPNRDFRLVMKVPATR